MQFADDSLYIHWHLLDGQNHDAPYSHEPARARHEQYMREPLLESAWRLMRLNRPQYIFHFTGGEPAIHPHFPELLAYVCNAGRNSVAVIDTNGLRSASFYQALFASAPRGKLCVNLHAHPDCIGLQDLLTRIGQVAESGNFCRVLLYHTPANAQQALRCYQKLAQFRKVLPFAFKLRVPLGGAVSWQAEVQAVFADAALPPLQMPGWAEPPQPVGRISGFCCVGVASLHAGADGLLSLGLKNDDQPWRPVILQNPVLEEDSIAGPVFATETEAEAWLKDFRIRSLRYELECGLARHPLHAGFSPEQRLQIELQNARALGARRALDTEPECWEAKRGEALRIWEGLGDVESRRVFVARLKAHMLGEGAYCVDSEYPLFAHGEIARRAAEMGEGGQAPAANGPDMRLLFFADGEDAEKKLHAIAWNMAAFGLALNDASWLETLRAAMSMLRGYALYLGQHGDKTVLYGVPPQLRRNYQPAEPREEGGRTLLSVIIVGHGWEQGLARSAESVFAEARNPREVLLACGEENASGACGKDEMLRTCRKLAQQYPGQIRFVPGDAGNGNLAVDACLHAARGEYVCFVPWGEACAGMDVAIAAMEREGADAAIPALTADTGWMQDVDCYEMPDIGGEMPGASCEISGNDGGMSSEDALLALKAKAGAYGAFGKVYKMALARKLALAWVDRPGNEEGEMFNLSFAGGGGKVLMMPELTGCLGGQTKPVLCRNFFREIATLETYGRARGLDGKLMAAREMARRKFERRMDDFIFMAAREEYAPELELDETQLRILLNYGLLDMIAQKLPAAPMPGALSEAPGAKCAISKWRPDGNGQACRLTLVVMARSRADLRFLQGMGWNDAQAVEVLVYAPKPAAEETPYLLAHGEMYANVSVYVMEEEILPQQAFELGREKAKGEWLAFLPAQEEMGPAYWQRLFEAIEAADAEDAAVYIGKKAEAPGQIVFADFAFRRSMIRAGMFCVNSPRWESQFLANMPANLQHGAKNADGEGQTALTLALADAESAAKNTRQTYEREEEEVAGAPFALSEATPALLLACYGQELAQGGQAAMTEICGSLREEFIPAYALAREKWEVPGLAALLAETPEELQRAVARAYARALDANGRKMRAKAAK